MWPTPDTPQRRGKRVLSIGDLHSGHQVGLTPPGFHPAIDDPRQAKFAAVRAEVWGCFATIVDRYRPIDVLICNGDAIDGKGAKSGGTEQISTDRNVQVAIAKACIKFVGAEKVRMTHGTNYHVGPDEDWETNICAELIAEGIDAKIGAHEWYDIEGVCFDVKHKIGSSQIPHGRLTALAREILWNRQWAADGKQPRADVLLRSHAHYYEQCHHDGCLGFILPALQGFGSKFGARECSGTVHIGAVVFDVYDGKVERWTPEIIEGETQIARAESL